MSFQSYGFFVLLAVTLAVCIPLARRSRSGAMWALLLACIFFYARGGHGLLAVLVLDLCVSLGTVRYLERTRDGKKRRRAALLAAGWIALVLIGFKYTAFLTGGALHPAWVPLGISFITFQQLWLIHEVYAGRFALGSDRTLLRMGLYTFFFPSVTSGPILKPQNFFPQLETEKFLHPDWQDAAAGLYAIAVGTIKKVLLADAFGVVVGNGWDRLAELSAPGAWVVILGYTLQLYFDFSGYCDMAAGLARLLGVRLPLNFDSPYRSLSIGEFWKRWHITLTSFLRECVYFPLGGSRKGTARTYLNIMAIFLISGIWHGAGWTFIVWGALHGLGQIIERAWGPRRDRLPGALRWAMTFLFVNLAWVFFRAPDLSSAVTLLQTAVTGGLAKPEPWLLTGLFAKETAALQLLIPALKPWMNVGRLFLLYGVGLLVVLLPRNAVRQMDTFRPTLWRAVLLVLGMTWSVLSFTGISTFIYSNF